MKSKLLLLFLLLHCAHFTNAQGTRVQFANNSPDNAFQGIDIYVDGTLFRDDISYRNATPFSDILPGNHTISVAPDNSTSVNDAFYTTNLILNIQDTVVIIATGTNTSTGFNPHKPFSLDVYMGAREMAHDPNNTELLFANGATDLGTVDFRSGIDTWIDNLDFGDITGYNEFAFGNSYTFRITNKTGSKAFQTYDITPQLPWMGLSGLVVTSGFLDPGSNNNGPVFETMIVFSNGGPFQPLFHVDAEAYARVQLIHSCADTLADTVDVYVNNDLVLDDVPYLSATNFMDAPAKTPLDIGIARMNSLSSSDTFYNLHTTFDSAGTYILVTHGIESSTGYNPAPPFDLKVYNQAKEDPSTSGATDMLFMHGSTDKPGFTIDQGSNNWLSTIYDGSFSSSYITKPSSDYIITLKDITDPNDTIRYNAALQSLGFANKAITIVAAGFKNPGNNSNGDTFRLYVAVPEGGPLFPLAIVPPEPGAVNEVYNNAVHIFPNPAGNLIRIDGLNNVKRSDIALYSSTGRLVKTFHYTGKDLYIGDLPGGIYFIQVKNGDTVLPVTRLVKQ